MSAVITNGNTEYPTTPRHCEYDTWNNTALLSFNFISDQILHFLNNQTLHFLSNQTLHFFSNQTLHMKLHLHTATNEWVLSKSLAGCKQLHYATV